MLLVSSTLAASYWFQAHITQETRQLIGQTLPTENTYVTEEDIGYLPEPVQRWLRHSGMVGKPFIHIGKVTQRAEMKLKPEQTDWMSAQAVQYSTVDPPSFIWTVDVRMNSFLGFRGRDKFEDGKGEMLIKVNSLFDVVKERGEKLDEGTLQRYLGEVVWFPSMALSPYISWETLSDSSVKATMAYKGTEGSGVFHFSSEGDFVLYSAKRFRGNESKAGRSEWILRVEDHQVFEGICVPSKMTATWELEGGEWTWLKLEIVDISYNEPLIPWFFCLYSGNERKKANNEFTAIASGNGGQ